MAKKSNPKIKDIVDDDVDDGIDSSDLADDLIVEGGDDLTKEAPENLEDIDVDEDLDLSDEGLEDLKGIVDPADDPDLVADPYSDDYYPYSDDDDSDSF